MFDIDGITNVILNYFRAMDKSDMLIDFVVPNDIRDDIKLDIELFGSQIYKITHRNRNPIAYIEKLSRLIRQNNYDIIHAHGNSCTLALEMYAAKKAGAKVRISHSHNSTCKYKLVHKLLRKPFDSLYTQAYACGQKAGEWLYAGKKFEIIKNGIEIDTFRFNKGIREEYREKYKLNGKVVVGHIGNFNYQKNQEYIINIFVELFQLNNNYRLVLVGDGELRPNMEKKVKELGLEEVVLFTGNILFVPQIIQAMDLIVMPSRFEGLPMTLIEAQSACLPCFVSDLVGKEVAITDLVTFLSLKTPPKEWAAQINQFVPEDREQITNNIYQQVVDAGYSINDNAKRVKEMYFSYI
jgi:glycosyltransferase involved in cell wall biosynthesis